jgi:hypothetical protein
MRGSGRVIMLLAGLAAQSPALAKPAETPAPLQPISPWAIEYADASCRLIRNFGDAQHPLTLAFERFQPGPDLRLGIAGDMLKLSHSARTLKFQYGPNGPQREGPLLETELADGRTSYLLQAASLNEVKRRVKDTVSGEIPVKPYVAADELAAAGKVSSLTLVGSFKDKLTVDLGPMEKPLQALQGCVGELMHEWGIEPDRLASASRRATPTRNPQNWMDSSDYPREMLARRRQGAVGFRLVIGEMGQVERCSVDVDKPGAFENAVCRAITKRARFKPALDKDGKPMRGLYANTVRFQFPS